MNITARRKHLQVILKEARSSLQERRDEHSDKLQGLIIETIQKEALRFKPSEERNAVRRKIQANETDALINLNLVQLEQKVREQLMESPEYRRARRFSEAISAADLLQAWMLQKINIHSQEEEYHRRGLAIDEETLTLAEYPQIGRSSEGQEAGQGALPGGGEEFPRRKISWSKYFTMLRRVAPGLTSHPMWPKDEQALSLLAETLGEIVAQTEYEASVARSDAESIQDIYKEAYLGSCMHSNNNLGTHALNWYATAPAQLLVLRSKGKLAARAWLWEVNGPDGKTKVLDRIYPGGDKSAHVRAMIEFGRSLGATDWRDSQSIKGKFSSGPYTIENIKVQYPMPYLDSITHVTALNRENSTATLSSHDVNTGKAPRNTLTSLNNMHGCPELGQLLGRYEDPDIEDDYDDDDDE